jgi:3-hydroxyacyl-[acyl-carrier-protein] dehydratase
MSKTPQFELDTILAILPHRPPFLFVDRVMRLEPGRAIIAERLLRPEEPYFAGHFPGRPILPGVLVTEALAQTSGLLLGLSQNLAPALPLAPPPLFFLAANSIKYTHPAAPGEILELRAETGQQFGGLHRFQVEAAVGRHVVATGSLTLARVGDRP